MITTVLRKCFEKTTRLGKDQASIGFKLMPW